MGYFAGLWYRIRLRVGVREAAYIVIALGVLLRAAPGWMNWAWGPDFGIYYGITKQLVEKPQLFQPYNGWGGSYNYFPVLYLVVALIHMATGLDIDLIMAKIPALISLLQLYAFWKLAQLIQGKYSLPEYTALLMLAALAFNPFHIYEMSHAAPLAMGHLFMTTSLYLYLRIGQARDSNEVPPRLVGMLYLSTILLIGSHHLTTFIYLISINGIFVYTNLFRDRWTPGWKDDIFYILASYTLAFFHWTFIATRVYSEFFRHGTGLPSWSIIVLAYASFTLSLLIIVIRRKLGVPVKMVRIRALHYIPMVTFAVLGFEAFMVAFVFYDFGTGFQFLPVAPLVLFPYIFVLAFSFVGLSTSRGDLAALARGWLYPMIYIFLYSIITWNPVLFPFRFLEYLAYPFAMLSALGITAVYREIDEIGDSEVLERHHAVQRDHRRWKEAFTAVVTVFLVLSGAMAYSVQSTTTGYEEAVSFEVSEMMEWMQGHIEPGVTVASDHRLSVILWSYGYNATYDDAYWIWFSTRWNDSRNLDELNGIPGKFGRVDYILIDSVMAYEGVQRGMNETPRPLNYTFYEKFTGEPYELVYETTSEDHRPVDNEYEDEIISRLDLPQSSSWCRLYRVNWTYIEENQTPVAGDGGGVV